MKKTKHAFRQEHTQHTMSRTAALTDGAINHQWHRVKKVLPFNHSKYEAQPTWKHSQTQPLGDDDPLHLHVSWKREDDDGERVLERFVDLLEPSKRIN